MQRVLRSSSRALFPQVTANHSLHRNLHLPAPNGVKTYISASDDPYLNLSIEHALLQRIPDASTVLFQYINRPCIVIGRNQNPWVEVNLGLLNHNNEGVESRIGKVDLVRRRSGGGTVFHDEGNANWSVICPSKSFTRDKHAEMVVRALRALGVERARVNERHDVVLDQGPHDTSMHPAEGQNDEHWTPYASAARPLKVSGSAYKLIRGKALHHGTCLLQSPNLDEIPRYLRSPEKDFITAKGSESVSSPVGNIGIGVGAFQQRVEEEFTKLYGVESVGGDLLDDADIRKGYEELKSAKWIYGQTPQFTVSIPLPVKKGQASVYLKIEHGTIVDALVNHTPEHVRNAITFKLNALHGRDLNSISSWEALLHGNSMPAFFHRNAVEQMKLHFPLPPRTS